MGVVDVMAGVFCTVDGDVKPRVGISHNIKLYRHINTNTYAHYHTLSHTHLHTVSHHMHSA